MNVARRLGTTMLSSMDFIVHYVRGTQKKVTSGKSKVDGLVGKLSGLNFILVDGWLFYIRGNYTVIPYTIPT